MTKDRKTSEPGGCECMSCGDIFIGGPEHDECGECHAEAMMPPAGPIDGQRAYEAWCAAGRQIASPFALLDRFECERWAAMERRLLQPLIDEADHWTSEARALKMQKDIAVGLFERCVAGIDHLAKISRQWEPDHSSGKDRRGWVLAKDARDDAQAWIEAA